MRVRFLALGESRQRTISLIQQTHHECESRRVCEPPGPTTSSLLPLGRGTPTHLRCSKPWATQQHLGDAQALTWLGLVPPGSDSCPPPQVI